MALAFRRSTGEADKAIAGYYGTFRDYYGFGAIDSFPAVEQPITFDWDSLKAISGEAGNTWNKDMTAKSVLVADAVKSNANKFSGGTVYKVTSKGDKNKELAWKIMRKQIDGVVVHFAEDGTVPGRNNWTYEVKDKKLHCTCHVNFTKPWGGVLDFDDGTFLWDYLDDHENLSFELLKATIENDKSGSGQRVNSDGATYLKGVLGKDFPVTLNWDEIRAIPGRSIEYSNAPPSRNNYLALKALNETYGMGTIRYATDMITKDAMGKEAFLETFDGIQVNLKAGDNHAAAVRKDGKKLVFDLTIKPADYLNAHRSWDYKKLGKDIEGML